MYTCEEQGAGAARNNKPNCAPPGVLGIWINYCFNKTEHRRNEGHGGGKRRTDGEEEKDDETETLLTAFNRITKASLVITVPPTPPQAVDSVITGQEKVNGLKATACKGGS
jgi:hypothetical protein